MTNEQLRQAAATMLAAADGKQIQIRIKSDNAAGWSTIEDPNWNFFGMEYRVKPEPLRVWAVIDVLGTFCGFYFMKESAEQNAKGGKIVEFMEATK